MITGAIWAGQHRYPVLSVGLCHYKDPEKILWGLRRVAVPQAAVLRVSNCVRRRPEWALLAPEGLVARELCGEWTSALVPVLHSGGKEVQGSACIVGGKALAIASAGGPFALRIDQ